MFGYLIASANLLTEEELERYKSCYCGLCRCLKEQHGQLSRLTLNYDMTFLVLLLQSLYEPEEKTGDFSCAVHPREKRRYEISNATEYACDMLVALSYYKFDDNWRDEGSIAGLAGKALFKSQLYDIKSKYPMQTAAIEQSVFELNALESVNSDDADAAAATFGHLMGSIFLFKGDRWSDTMYRLGNSLGRFIYLMDAVIDLDSDTKKNRYNPFRKYYGLDNEQRFRDILKLFLGDAVAAFDVLPLVKDTGILKNILCSGLWAAFEEKYGSIQSTGSKP